MFTVLRYLIVYGTYEEPAYTISHSSLFLLLKIKISLLNEETLKIVNGILAI